MSDDNDEEYGWERLPNNIGHDRDAYTRINGITKNDNGLSNCLHCGTYAYPGDICLECKEQVRQVPKKSGGQIAMAGMRSVVALATLVITASIAVRTKRRESSLK